MRRAAAVTLVVLGGGLAAGGIASEVSHQRACDDPRRSMSLETEQACAASANNNTTFRSRFSAWSHSVGRGAVSVARGGFGAIGHALGGHS